MLIIGFSMISDMIESYNMNNPDLPGYTRVIISAAQIISMTYLNFLDFSTILIVLVLLEEFESLCSRRQCNIMAHAKFCFSTYKTLQDGLGID